MTSDFLDCELHLSARDQICLRVAGREYTGQPALGGDLRNRLRAATLDGVHYGTLLFEAIFPHGDHGVRAGYRDGLAIAQSQGKRLRLRLRIAALPELSDIRWELLYDPQREMALGRSQSTSLSRYLEVPWEPGTAVVERPRMLVALSCPCDAADYGLAELDRQEMRESLTKALRPFGVEATVEILDGPTTPRLLRERLRERFHVLHVQAHGIVRDGDATAHLVLEGDDGSARMVDEALLAEICEGDRDLRLVTLMACHSGALATADPFSGLAPALVREGIPAVIAMRRAISLEMAELFTEHLYLELAHTGRIDAAVNEARQQLYLAAPDSIDWAIPTLYMRLPQGQLWLAYEPPTEVGQIADRPSPARKAAKIPRREATGWWKLSLATALALALLWAASIFTGREPLGEVTLAFSAADGAIYPPFREAARDGSFVVRVEPLSAPEAGARPLRVAASGGEYRLELPPGLHRLSTERPEVELVPEVIRTTEAPQGLFAIEMKFFGNTLVIQKPPAFMEPIFVASATVRAEIPARAESAVVVTGVPAGHYRIFSQESPRYHTLSRELVVAPRSVRREGDRSGTYTVEFIPQKVPTSPPPSPPLALPSPPQPVKAEIPKNRSEANFRTLLRAVKIACTDPTAAGRIDHIVELLEGTIRGDDKMPVREDRRQELRQLRETLQDSGCPGLGEWLRQRQE